MHCLQFGESMDIKVEFNKFVKQLIDTAVIDDGDSFCSITKQNGKTHSNRPILSV